MSFDVSLLKHNGARKLRGLRRNVADLAFLVSILKLLLDLFISHCDRIGDQIAQLFLDDLFSNAILKLLNCHTVLFQDGLVATECKASIVLKIRQGKNLLLEFIRSRIDAE